MAVLYTVARRELPLHLPPEELLADTKVVYSNTSSLKESMLFIHCY